MNQAVHQTNLPNLPLVARGKVRDIYQIDDFHLLFVTTDRISAFDVIMPAPVPGKGEILTQISNFWFHKSEKLIDNHLTDLNLADYVSDEEYQRLKTEWNGYSGYDRWMNQPLNNARMNTISTYHQYVPAFTRLLSHHQGDLQAFYQAVDDLGDLPDKQRAQTLKQLAN